VRLHTRLVDFPPSCESAASQYRVGLIRFESGCVLVFHGGVFGCSSRMNGKPSSPVLRGLGASNGAWPLDSNPRTRFARRLYEVSERKTTVFLSQKLCVLSCYFVALCGAFLTRFPFIPGPLHGPSRSRPSGLRRSVAGCALTPSSPALSRYLLRLLPHLRPSLPRRLRYRRSASSRQNTLLHADNFTLRRTARPLALHSGRWRKEWRCNPLRHGIGRHLSG
jgi:hypothetical protein